MRTSKEIVLTAILGLMILFIATPFVQAQETEIDPLMNQLSQEQQEMLQTQRQLMLRNREQLRA
ncbi:MAG: hypothetical protein WBV45_13050, partial [Lutimonas sp.]